MARKSRVPVLVAGAAAAQLLLDLQDQQAAETDAAAELAALRISSGWKVHCLARATALWCRMGQDSCAGSITRTAAVLAGLPESMIFDEEYPLQPYAWKAALEAVVSNAPVEVLQLLHLPSLRYAMQHLPKLEQEVFTDLLLRYL